MFRHWFSAILASFGLLRCTFWFFHSFRMLPGQMERSGSVIICGAQIDLVVYNLPCHFDLTLPRWHS
jgi:hypothetical protein